jgi:cell division septation protein DedD
LDKVADATARHRARIQPAALTFFDELRQPTQKEQMKLEKAAPPKHVVAALDAQIPVNPGEKNEAIKKEKAPEGVPVALVAASNSGLSSKASVQAEIKEDRGVEMASALARLLGEPVDVGFEPQPTPTPKILSSAKAPLNLKAWGIQTSVFSEKYSATSLVDHLRSKGYEARLSRKGDAGYTVFVSGFKGENAALTAQERLSKEEGLSSFLVRP